MKKPLLLLSLLLPLLHLSAQITVSPGKPEPTDLLTLTFDASQGNAGLADCDCDIYAHTGVLTDKSNGPGDWRHVAAGWGENKPALHLKKTGDNLFQLQFRMKDLYQSGDEKILAMTFVFRNADGSKTGKAEGERDIFYYLGEVPAFEDRRPEIFKVSETPHPDWAKDASIYEVNIRQYTKEGTFKAFARHLPRLQKMGVDILWLMPVQPIGIKDRKGSLGSYYSIRDYTAANPEFGSMEDFRRLVEQSHQLGLKVVLDWVGNHTSRDHTWIAKHPDWYNYGEDGSIVAPSGWTDVADLNYDNPDMRKAMADAMIFWVKEAGLDGFRCDVAGAVPTDFWESVRPELEAIKPVWMIAEDEGQPWLMNKAFNSNYGWSFHHTMNDIAKGSQDAGAVFSYFERVKDLYPSGAYPMQFITNHDENSWNGTEYERLGEGHKAFATLSFTVPGMPLIYSGQEAGLKRRLPFFEKDSIDWTNPELIGFYTQLNTLKADNPALWNGSAGGWIEEIENDRPKAVASFRRIKEDNEVVAVINLSGAPQQVAIELEKPPGIYREYFSGKDELLSYGAKLDLAPWEYRVFVFEDQAPQIVRQYLGFEQTPDCLIVRTSDGAIRITPHSEGAMEVTFQFQSNGRVNPPSYALASDASPMEVSLQDKGAFLEYATAGIAARVDKMTAKISLFYKGSPVLSEESGYFDYGYTMGFRFNLPEGEKLMGGGERVLGMDRRGKRLQLYNNPSYGYETHAELMYYSLPVVVSSKKYMLVFDNGARGYLDLGATEEYILQLEAVGGRASYLVVAADEWAGLAENFTALTGRQPMPPRWALGNIASRMGYHSQREVEAVADKYLEDDIPLDGIVLDLFWFGPDVKGHLGNLEWDLDSFPQPERMMAGLKEKGVNTVLITEPFILKGTGKYQEVLDKGLVGLDASGKPYHYDFYFGNTTLLDLFKPEAREWFWEIYKKHTLSGVDGWWGDLGEPERHPDDMIHVNGRGDEVHNLYGHIWAKTIFDGYTKDFPTRRPMILMRSGFVGSQRYGMIPWTGDVNRTWGGLKPQVELSLSMGLQGLAYMHSDLGGFAGNYKDAELYTRWLQYGVFQPVYRTHAQEDVPAEPVFWDEDTKDIVRRYIKLRYALMPYNYTLLYENAVKGTPMMRPLFYVDENPALLENTTTYLWGDDFLVTPVTDKGATTQKVHLPENADWFNYWTGEAFEGGREIEVPVDIDNIPVFVKIGAFIPMAPPIQSTKDYSSSKLILHYYHDTSVGQSEGYMYEDDGHTKEAYLTREYELLKFSAEYKKEKLRISVMPEGYDYQGRPELRDIELVVHNVREKPRSVGKKYAYAWDEASQALTIKMKVGRETVSVVVKQ
ncbi:MAG: DUF5110 domain-containing protein [Saprospirales bacterium]|nr:DUF5110 domain-containing protein [Saprospirales bacterium]